MSILAEFPWLADDHGAVKVRAGRDTFLVVESEWARTAGTPQATTVAVGPDQTFTTSFPGLWGEVMSANPDRQEAYVCNVHSNPNAVVLVSGGPFGPKPIWPDGPPFVTTDWKGPIRIMSPSHYVVRCCGSEV
jgi:hypothetical protein